MHNILGCISVTANRQHAGVVQVLHSSSFTLQGTLLVCCVYTSVNKCLCGSICKSVRVCVLVMCVNCTFI